MLEEDTGNNSCRHRNWCDAQPPARQARSISQPQLDARARSGDCLPARRLALADPRSGVVPLTGRARDRAVPLGHGRREGEAIWALSMIPDCQLRSTAARAEEVTMRPLALACRPTAEPSQRCLVALADQPRVQLAP